MSQVETVPQSLVDTRIILLKPRLDLGDIKLIGDTIKPRLFGKFGFNPKPRDIRFVSLETYFEPFLIIGGRYSLDYCRKHIFEISVPEKTNRLFIAGQEFKPEKSGSKTGKEVIKIMGEEHAHHQTQAYFVLDRMKREVQPETLPISPFEERQGNSELNSNFKSIQISDDTQIEFLKRKIAKKPADVAEIIKEVFDITDRTIAYYPMYQLTLENARNQKQAMLSINGITGEIILNGTKKVAVKTIVVYDEIKSTEMQPKQPANLVEELAGPFLDTNRSDTTDNTQKTPKQEDSMQQQESIQQQEQIQEEPIQPTLPNDEQAMILGFPAKISGEVFSVGDNVAAVVGDLEVSSGTNVNRTIVVKGALTIGDDCRVRGKLKALKSITVGANTSIDGDVISGGNVFVGPGVIITGRLQAEGCVKIEEQATIKRGLRSNRRRDRANEIQLEVNFDSAIEQVEQET